MTIPPCCVIEKDVTLSFVSRNPFVFRHPFDKMCLKVYWSWNRPFGLKGQRPPMSPLWFRDHQVADDHDGVRLILEVIDRDFDGLEGIFKAGESAASQSDPLLERVDSARDPMTQLEVADPTLANVDIPMDGNSQLAHILQRGSNQTNLLG